MLLYRVQLRAVDRCVVGRQVEAFIYGHCARPEIRWLDVPAIFSRFTDDQLDIAFAEQAQVRQLDRVDIRTWVELRRVNPDFLNPRYFQAISYNIRRRVRRDDACPRVGKCRRQRLPTPTKLTAGAGGLQAAHPPTTSPGPMVDRRGHRYRFLVAQPRPAFTTSRRIGAHGSRRAPCARWAAIVEASPSACRSAAVAQW